MSERPFNAFLGAHKSYFDVLNTRLFGTFLKNQFPTPAIDAFLAGQKSYFQFANTRLFDTLFKNQFPTPAIDASLAANKAQFRLALGTLDTNTAFRAAMSGSAAPTTLVVDDTLGELERALGDSDREVGPDGATLLAVWSESLRDFRSWLLQPVVKASAIGLVLFLLSYWWVTLKAEHPDVADAVEVPVSILVGLLVGMAANARKK